MEQMDISSHLDAVENKLKELIENTEKRPELKNIKEQFRIIDQSIRQLRKQGLSVPPEMINIRDNFIAEIEKYSMPIENLQKAYNKALDIVVELGRICRHSPRKDLYLKAKERRGSETGVDTLSKLLVEILKKMGGSGHEKYIFKKFEENFQEKMTKADMESPKGRTPRWQTNLKRARKKLITEGVLTTESKGRKWTLASI